MIESTCIAYSSGRLAVSRLVELVSIREDLGLVDLLVPVLRSDLFDGD
jgi:hypothetical protein